MFNFLSRQKFTPKFYKKNYSDLGMSNKVNDTISNSLIYTYKDYRNHLLQEKYKK